MSFKSHLGRKFLNFLKRWAEASEWSLASKFKACSTGYIMHPVFLTLCVDTEGCVPSWMEYKSSNACNIVWNEGPPILNACPFTLKEHYVLLKIIFSTRNIKFSCGMPCWRKSSFYTKISYIFHPKFTCNNILPPLPPPFWKIEHPGATQVLHRFLFLPNN